MKENKEDIIIKPTDRKIIQDLDYLKRLEEKLEEIRSNLLVN